MPRIKAYEIGAIFEVGMYEYDNGVIFMPLEAAQLYFQLDGRANELEVMVKDPDRVGTYRKDIAAAVGGAGRLVDWQQANASFFTALKVERNVMFLILSLIIMVAAFNIISGMIMLVKDKGRDIAILRTMGATRGAIMRIFFMSGAAIGVVGTLAGFLLGVAFAANIETIRQWLQGSPAPSCSPPRSTSSRTCRPGSRPWTSSAWSRWGWSCRCSRPSIRRGARRGSIRSKRYAMNDAACAPCGG